MGGWIGEKMGGREDGGGKMNWRKDKWIGSRKGRLMKGTMGSWVGWDGG